MQRRVSAAYHCAPDQFITRCAPDHSAYAAAVELPTSVAGQQVTLTPSPKLCFRPHPVHDGGEYDSMADLVERLAGEGYGGGIRLLKVAHLLLPRWLKGTPGAAEEWRPGAHRARGLGRAPAERQGSGADAGAPAGDLQALLGVLRAAWG